MDIAIFAISLTALLACFGLSLWICWFILLWIVEFINDAITIFSDTSDEE